MDLVTSGMISPPIILSAVSQMKAFLDEKIQVDRGSINWTEKGRITTAMMLPLTYHRYSDYSLYSC